MYSNESQKEIDIRVKNGEPEICVFLDICVIYQLTLDKCWMCWIYIYIYFTHKLNRANDMNDSCGKVVSLYARLTSTEFTHTCVQNIRWHHIVSRSHTIVFDSIKLYNIYDAHTYSPNADFLMMCFLYRIKYVIYTKNFISFYIPIRIVHMFI